MTTIRLGNPAAILYKPNIDGEDPQRDGVLDEPAVTTIRTSPDSTTAQSVDEVLRIWRTHSDADAPSWMECDDELLATLLTETWGKLGGAPKSVEKSHHSPDGAPGTGSRASWPLVVLAALLVLARMSLLLRTNAGRDHQSRVSFDPASDATSTFAPASYIGVTEDATAPAAGDTTLTAELTTEGFARAVVAYAHTNGTNTVTLTKTFTMSGGTSRTIRHAGLFNLSAAGAMAYKTAVPSPPTLVSGDSVAITWTFTL